MSLSIQRILDQLTLEEKVAMCHAHALFSSAGVPRLGIPELVMSDGPHGVRQEFNPHGGWTVAEGVDDAVTAMPVGICLAATWNPDLAEAYGDVLGAEARARGKDILLAPGFNIIRTPLCGRNFEYYSEDPCLISALAPRVVQGIQRHDVAACAKHFALNNQELNRGGVNVEVDERALREVYLAGFEAAVKQGDVLTVMGAYNLFRGQHCCHHRYLLRDILKGEWAFQGLVVSDWAGVHDTAEAAANGLDIEMGGGSKYDQYYLANPYLEGLRDGRYSLDDLDDKVRRILTVMAALKMLPDQEPRATGAMKTQKHQSAARRVAAEGIVLMKNEGALLPLDPSRIRKLVVVGQNAVLKHAHGGGSSEVKPLYEIAPLEALQERVGQQMEITYFKGYPQDPDGLDSPDIRLMDTDVAGVRGWKAVFYDAFYPKGSPVLRRTDAAIDIKWDTVAPVGDRLTGFSAVWETNVTAPESGRYLFSLNASNAASLEVDGKRIMHIAENREPATLTHDMELEEGRTYTFRVTLWAHYVPVVLRFGWIVPSRAASREADGQQALLEAARKADAVLFFGGLNHLFDKEASDRESFSLPYGQDRLIQQLAEANARTVVVTYGGGAFACPWIEQVRAMLHVWYPGMEGGHAVVDALWGDVNPSGKLPVTFPKRLEDCAAHSMGEYGIEQSRYTEGIFIGYRHHDRQNIDPLFCFGHGLSYTSFAYSDLHVEPGDDLVVSFTLTNTGARAGAEVAQCYIGKPTSRVERPACELKAFQKIMLAAGESRRLTLVVPRQHLAYYDEAARAWTVEPGRYMCAMGASSRDKRLEVDFELQP